MPPLVNYESDKSVNDKMRNTTVILDILGNSSHLCRGAVVDVPNVEVIRAPKNFIRFMEPGCFENIPYLELIDLSGNTIEAIQPNIFTGFELLRNLILSNNSISILEPYCFRNCSVGYIDLDRNRITTIRNRVFPDSEITYINLNHNPLREIEEEAFHDMITLHVLQIEGCDMTYLNPRWFLNSTIIILNMNHNKLTYLGPNCIISPTMMDLHFENNYIKFVHPQAFVSMGDLKTISLYGNFIENLHIHFNPNVLKLKKLNISRNNINDLTQYSIRPNIIIGKNSRYTYINTNRFMELKK